MTVTKKQIGMIKAMQSRLGLDDAAYRAMLRHVAGKESATKLSGAEAARVIDHMRRLIGRDGASGAGRYRPRSDKAYVRRIHVVWRLLAEAGAVNKRGLNGFVRRMTGIDNVEWLEPEDGRKVNEALKAIAAREGVSLGRD